MTLGDVIADPTAPENWVGRVLLFAVYPLIFVVLVVLLMLLWPACLFVHKLTRGGQREPTA